VDCPPKCSSCEGQGQITARRQREISEKYAVRFDDYSPSSQVSLTLVALNVAVFALTFGAPQDLQHQVWRALVNRPDSLQTLELWRFVTPMLAHVSFWHLALNSWFLACYCPSLEGAYGRWRFLALYLAAGMAGNILSWLFNPPPYGVGASGALMGVGAAYIGLHYRWGYFDAALVRWWALYLVGWIVLGFAAASWVRMDNWGHLGGALAGLAYAMLTPRPRGH
jgi:membrane associated rhomboid family serine protease